MPAPLAHHQAFPDDGSWLSLVSLGVWYSVTLAALRGVVHQRHKRDRLPSAARLQAAQDRVQGWWEEAYLQALNPVLPVRFTQEACASLPGLLSTAGVPSLDDCFTAILLQQVRLKHDQQVPEWRD